MAAKPQNIRSEEGGGQADTKLGAYQLLVAPVNNRSAYWNLASLSPNRCSAAACFFIRITELFGNLSGHLVGAPYNFSIYNGECGFAFESPAIEGGIGAFTGA